MVVDCLVCGFDCFRTTWGLVLCSSSGCGFLCRSLVGSSLVLVFSLVSGFGRVWHVVSGLVYFRLFLLRVVV